MMRRMFGILCALMTVLLLIGSASAQTNLGNMAVMGTVAFSTTSGDGSVTNFNLSPRGYYFLMDQVAVGGRLSFNSTSSGGATFTDVLFGPDGLYFFKTDMDNLLPFAGLGLFLSNHSNGESTTGITFSMHGGLAYLLKPHLSIFPEAAFDISSRDSKTTTQISIGVGLAGFLY